MFKKNIYIRFNLRLCHLPRCTLYCSNILALRSPTSRQPCAAMNRAFFRGVLKEAGPSSSTIHTRYPLLIYVIYVLVISFCVSIFMYVIIFKYTFMFIIICCVCVLIKHMHIFLFMCMCIYIYMCVCCCIYNMSICHKVTYIGTGRLCASVNPLHFRKSSHVTRRPTIGLILW